MFRDLASHDIKVHSLLSCEEIGPYLISMLLPSSACSGLHCPGDYQDYIDKALHRDGMGGSDPTNVLFQCTNAFGSIEVVYDCLRPCLDGGEGKDDYCQPTNGVTEQHRVGGLLTSSSAKMRNLQHETKHDRKIEALSAAVEVLAEALHERKAEAEGFKDPAEALAVVAVALEL